MSPVNRALTSTRQLFPTRQGKGKIIPFLAYLLSVDLLGIGSPNSDLAHSESKISLDIFSPRVWPSDGPLSEYMKSVFGQALPDCRDIFDLMPGVRKRIVHIAFKRDVEAWIDTDRFTQFDHGPYVPVIPERNREGSFC